MFTEDIRRLLYPEYEARLRELRRARSRAEKLKDAARTVVGILGAIAHAVVFLFWVWVALEVLTRLPPGSGLGWP